MGVMCGAVSRCCSCSWVTLWVVPATTSVLPVCGERGCSCGGLAGCSAARALASPAEPAQRMRAGSLEAASAMACRSESVAASQRRMSLPAAMSVASSAGVAALPMR